MPIKRGFWPGLVLGVLWPLAGVLADVLPGSDDPGFASAVALWLDDGEDAALPLLAAQAQDGNPSAQLLLAIIDKTPALQGPWLARLPRAERVVLMRNEGGLSGRSWIHAAAEQMPHAALWQTLWRTDAPATLALDFARAGEPRAAAEAAIFAAARETGGLAEIAADPDYPVVVKYLAWTDGAEVVLEGMHPGDPQRRDAGMSPDPAQHADWLATAPEAALPRALCETRCSGTVPACTLAAIEALGAHAALLTLGTPSEALIPSAEFNQSVRGQAAYLRRMILSVDARGRQHLLRRIDATDACLAGVFTGEVERYRTVPATRSD